MGGGRSQTNADETLVVLFTFRYLRGLGLRLLAVFSNARKQAHSRLKMENIIIVGGGISGLAAALYLTKQGHTVTVLEKDDAPLPNSAADAFAWDRRGAPQVRHSHGMLARLRNLLREDHPEVLQRLLDEGATEMKLYEKKPADKGVVKIEERDKELVMLACRRTTLEWVLRQSVLEAGKATFRSGVAVKALTSVDDDAKSPTVNGVVIDDDSSIRSDLVIVADGRRSSLPKWLQGIGVSLGPDDTEPAGIVYFTRFYELKPGQPFPSTELVAGDIGYLVFAAFCGDNNTFSITLSANEDDKPLQKVLKDAAKFDAIASKIPEVLPWVASGDAITDVAPMSGLTNRRRHFVREGQAVVKGLHAIGDAHVCTNPAYGRGLSTGVWQARLLAEAIAAEPEDLEIQSLHFCSAVDTYIVPWFDSSVMMDSGKRIAREAAASGHDTSGADDNPMKLLSEVASIDPMIWQLFWRTMNLLESPDVLMSAEFLGRFGEIAGLLAEERLVSNSNAVVESVPSRNVMLNLIG